MLFLFTVVHQSNKVSSSCKWRHTIVHCCWWNSHLVIAYKHGNVLYFLLVMYQTIPIS